MIEPTDLRNATLEAIYAWNRTEGYYYSYFSRLDELHKKPEVFEFFTTKIFEVFLSDYSIRRNIKSGYKNVDFFLQSLIDYGFVESVKNGDIESIDDISSKLKNEKEVTNKKETRSLLSKVAFLINPDDFSLLDNLAKRSLWGLIKNKKNCLRKELDSYTNFIEQTNLLTDDDLNNKIIKEQMVILEDFKDTKAYSFFSENKPAFERRIIDKYLWLNEINSEGRVVNNLPYREFVTFAL